MAAEQVSREQDIADLRLGQRILVDDGSCPAGQIKEVSGAKMTTRESSACEMHSAPGAEEKIVSTCTLPPVPDACSVFCAAPQNREPSYQLLGAPDQQRTEGRCAASGARAP
jgi:hypothetical protein